MKIDRDDLLNLESEDYQKWDRERVLAQLNRIEASAPFRRSPKLVDFLRFIVMETLEGRGKDLKQYTVAIQAFGRSTDFDPADDPIVRIQAGRLRRRLQEYYQGIGHEDLIQIDLPKGTYAPIFQVKNSTANSESGSTEKTKPLEENWNYTIAVCDFTNLSGDPTKQYIAEGFSVELSLELSKYQHLPIMRVPLAWAPPTEEEKKSPKARFMMDGTIRLSPDAIKVSVSLHDNKTRKQVFSRSFAEPFLPENLIHMQERIAAEAAHKVGDYFDGIIFKKLFAESRKESIRTIQGYDSLLYHHYYEQHPTPAHQRKAWIELEKALEADPNFGLGWSALSNIYADSISLDYGICDVTSRP